MTSERANPTAESINESQRPRLLSSRRAAAALLLGSPLVSGAAAPESGAAPGGEAIPDADLNTIVVIVDDMDDFACKDTEKFLPKSSKWLLDKGTCFENATVTTPVCCPARAEIQTGRLPHNSHVERQIDAAKLNTKRTIQHFLGRAGVVTYGAGKLVNGIRAGKYAKGTSTKGKFDTAFSDHDFFSGGSDYYNYSLIDDEGKKYKPQPSVHATIQTGRFLQDFIIDMAAADEPFYAHIGFSAPHTESKGKLGFPTPTPAHLDSPVPQFHNKSEKNAKDKLLPFHELDKHEDKNYLKRFHTARVRSHYGVDDEIAKAFEALEETGEIDNTAVIYVSDNGYSLGQNNWLAKAVPYPGSINIPMLAYLPGQFKAGKIDKRDVGLVDLAPTIYDMYGIEPSYTVDGHSLLSDYKRRHGQYFEFRNELNKFVLDESGFAPTEIPDWNMYIAPNGDAYIVFSDKGKVIQREFYKDPGMRQNLLAPEFEKRRPSPAKIERMEDLLDYYKTCRGTREQNSPHPCT